ncbi:DNA-binding LacI/PurR family transcriptional regulator [Pelomonas saccharophila]|uniref:DNA-binding LacI/PurR family transcriptional regulator n=2 Tax=Roseateles saccharophilus TaxID=304 RepID=A0ABU1YIQ8_ROSSA|nr:DNA-binding LacI/PurR family transcriptional regulator [Roseateles saccharophilus]
MAASVVLNGAKSATRTSAETRARVVAAAERLHYRANATARALANGRANAIGIVASHWKEDANLYFMEILGGIIESATPSRQTVSVFMLQGWEEAQQRIPEICDGRVDGLILVAPRLGIDVSGWMPRQVPVTSLHSENAIDGVVNLEPDEEAGSFEAVSQMLAIGHRRILHIGGPAGLLGAQRRLAGYRRAHEAARLQPPDDHVVHSSLNADGGREAVLDWLQRHHGEKIPEAVFCANDAIALGCIQALAMKGLRVPEDVSVVGFDDIWFARASSLATVRQPLHAMGRRATEVLMEQIQARREGGQWQGPANIILPTEFVHRATLKSPR